jgi:LuxR family maltose regulon positive regulatory protein
VLTAETCEQRSWEAWWRDDRDAVRDARERAYRLYRACDDDTGAARMATWMASDALDFDGAVAVANGWLRRAHRLLDGRPASPEHGWLAFHEGYLARTGGDDETARAHGVVTAGLGRRFGVVDLEMLGLALEGAALVAATRVPEDMDRLDEATALALEGEAAVPIASAWTCCFLVTACTAVLDFERASAWCDRIAEFADRHGSRYMLAFCRAEYGEVDLWRGRWDEAEALLEASAADFAASRPALSGGPLRVLAELRRRQGRATDAEALLDRLGDAPGAQLCRARLALDRGDAEGAIALLERRLRQATGLARAPLLELLARAQTARRALDDADAAVAALRAIARQAGTPAMRACADRAEGLLALTRGERDRGRRLLEDAADRFAAAGGAHEAAQTRLALAARSRGGPITPREQDVLRLLTEGLTNQQIAERLVISEHTVHRHVTNILRKLDLPSRSAAAAHAVRIGI